MRTRRRIETILAQLVEHFRLTRLWAGNRWRLTARVLRKALSQTLTVVLCLAADLDSLSFDALIGA